MLLVPRGIGVVAGWMVSLLRIFPSRPCVMRSPPPAFRRISAAWSFVFCCVLCWEFVCFDPGLRTNPLFAVSDNPMLFFCHGNL